MSVEAVHVRVADLSVTLEDASAFGTVGASVSLGSGTTVPPPKIVCLPNSTLYFTIRCVKSILEMLATSTLDALDFKRKV